MHVSNNEGGQMVLTCEHCAEEVLRDREPTPEEQLAFYNGELIKLECGACGLAASKEFGGAL